MAGKTVARLYVDAKLAEGTDVPLDKAQSHYLSSVLRQKPGDAVLLFNGRDGEWMADWSARSKKQLVATCRTQTRPQTTPASITLAFAPLKHARLDYMAQKAAELGVARVQPVITDRTIVRSPNLDRLSSNMIEGAEQCGVMWVPNVGAPQTLAQCLKARDGGDTLLFFDENAASGSPLDQLTALGGGPVTVLIGPEGGFTMEEQAALRGAAGTVAMSLGPRIMRADTAAIAALALVQATLGDWPTA